MSFFVTSRLFVQSFIKSEIIFKNLVKTHLYPSNVVDKYINEIKEIQFHQNDTSVSEYLEFPFKTFYTLNKNSLKNIISKSFDIIKEKGLGSNPMIYSCVLKAYLKYGIDIDVASLLGDIVKNEVPLNEEICNQIIAYYCNHGEMGTVEILLGEMKSQNIRLHENSLFKIVSGYIIAGQPDKSEIFIKERNLNAESHLIIYSRCFGYASIGDVSSLRNILAEMKRNNVKFIPFRYFHLYEGLIHGKVDKSDLSEIIDFTKDAIEFSGAESFSLIASLNRADNFDYSLFIVNQFIDIVADIPKLFEVFATSRCPPTIFEQLFTIMEPRCRNISYEINIFGDMSFDTALNISQKFSQSKNWKVIYYSLINKAIWEKSLPLIKKALVFTFQNLKWPKINILLSQSLLPSMLNKGMVSNYDEILDLFPTFRNQISPVLLMKYLCYGDFDRYNNLRLNEKHMTNISLKVEWSYLVFELRNNLSLSKIEQWSMEARKCFHSQFIDNILENVLIYEMIELLKNKSMSDIEQLIGYAKEWNVKISQKNFEFLLRAHPEHSELLLNLLGKIVDTQAKGTSVG